MQQYPHDEFDEVDEKSKRRGVYRARDPRQGLMNASFFSMIGAGVAALVLGGFMYVYSPQLASPESTSSASASAPQPSASPEASKEATTVEIYNSGGIAGAATDAMNLLAVSDPQLTIAQVGNWHGTPVTVSTIYYTAGHQEAAQHIADQLGVTALEEKDTQDSPVVVVLGSDYVLSSLRVDAPTPAAG